ncbi:MAG: hypothetical protein ACOYM2_21250 [Rectinemataceae bacterium]
MPIRGPAFITMLMLLSLTAIAPVSAQDGAARLPARVADIIDSRCGSCHVWATSISGIAGRVVPGDPTASPLMIMIDSGRMPQGGPELAPEESEPIREWILSGADSSAAALTPVHALVGVAAPLAILGSGLLYPLP